MKSVSEKTGRSDIQIDRIFLPGSNYSSDAFYLIGAIQTLLRTKSTDQPSLPINRVERHHSRDASGNMLAVGELRAKSTAFINLPFDRFLNSSEFDSFMTQQFQAQFVYWISFTPSLS